MRRRDEMQKLMAELEELDTQGRDAAAGKTGRQHRAASRSAATTGEVTPEADRDQWYRQLTDMLSVGHAIGQLSRKASNELDQLQKRLDRTPRRTTI